MEREGFMNKTLAVIISAYGCPEYIMECFRSVAVQKKYPGWNYDIRIGVDGCPDTAKILNQNSVPFYLNKNNAGAYVMRNSLIYLRPADAYAYFDADDIMMKSYLFKNIYALESKNAQAVISAKINCYANMVAIGKGEPKIETGGAMTFTHKALVDLGGYYSHRCAGDTDLMDRLKMAGHKIEKIKEGLYRRRRHNKALTKSGLTVYGGAYRKKVWKEMCDNRDRGIIKIKPEIIKLEEY